MGDPLRAFGLLALLPLLMSPELSVAAQNVDFPGAVWTAANSLNYSISDRESNGLRIRWIIIHDVEGSAAACLSWFQDSAAAASSHYVIDYDGTVYQMVLEKDIAWHAGNWDYNKHSIGIEHAGYADRDCFTDDEYRASARLVAYLTRKYNISVVRPDGLAPPVSEQGTGIIGHDQVPDPSEPTIGGGKSHHHDPGRHWNWTLYLSLVMTYYSNASLPGPSSGGDEKMLEPLASLPPSLVLATLAAFCFVAVVVLRAAGRSSSELDNRQREQWGQLSSLRGPKT